MSEYKAEMMGGPCDGLELKLISLPRAIEFPAGPGPVVVVYGAIPCRPRIGQHRYVMHDYDRETATYQYHYEQSRVLPGDPAPCGMARARREKVLRQKNDVRFGI